MIIEVFVEGWQLDCCGDPFNVGSAITWSLHADDPADATDGIQRFVEDHHDLVDDDVPFWDISGRVSEIYAVSNRLVSVPGAKCTTNDQTDVAEDRVERAQRFQTPPDGFTAMGFRVRLTVDDDTELPTYAEAPWAAEQRDRAKVEEASLAALRSSEVGRQLAELCDSVAHRFDGRVEVLRSDRTTGVTIQPFVSGGCVVRWGFIQAEIRACVGDGDWSLPASPEGVARLERFVDAASAGDVREQVLPDQLVTVISESGVEFARAEIPFTPPMGTGTFIGTTDFERYRRGDINYNAW